MFFQPPTKLAKPRPVSKTITATTATTATTAATTTTTTTATTTTTTTTTATTIIVSITTTTAGNSTRRDVVKIRGAGGVSCQGPWSVCACLRSPLMQLLRGAAWSRSGLGLGFGFREFLCKLSSKCPATLYDGCTTASIMRVFPTSAPRRLATPSMQQEIDSQSACRALKLFSTDAHPFSA